MRLSSTAAVGSGTGLGVVSRRLEAASGDPLLSLLVVGLPWREAVRQRPSRGLLADQRYVRTKKAHPSLVGHDFGSASRHADVPGAVVRDTLQREFILAETHGL